MAPPSNIRKIIHIDMDAFYASVEQRDNPAYRGKPIVVGGSPEGRGLMIAHRGASPVEGVTTVVRRQW